MADSQKGVGFETKIAKKENDLSNFEKETGCGKGRGFENGGGFEKENDFEKENEFEIPRSGVRGGRGDVRGGRSPRLRSALGLR